MSKAQLALFLSPHFDDIALSCGGIAARLSRTGARCIGLTVCAAPHLQGEPLSPFAQGMHAMWESAGGQKARAINEVRREEERQAMRTMGLQPVWLDVPDAPYRRSSNGRFLYTSNEELLGTIAPEERRTLVPHVAREISRIARETGIRGRVRVFAPLAVGHHVDHRLVFWAARRLGPRFGLLFYEDYPYATREGALQVRIQELRELGLPMQPRTTIVSDLIGVKIAAINRYKSQLEGLFGSAEAMPPAVRGYMESVAGVPGQYAERFWYIPPVYTLA